MDRRRSPLPFVFALLMVWGSVAAQTPTAADPWEPLRFLLGDWAGTGSGKPGEAISGKTTFALELDGNVMVRHNSATYAPKAGEKREVVHRDLLVIYRQQGDQPFRAIYFDNEGHVINYNVSFPAGGKTAVFETDAGAKGPRFRLIYALGADGSLSVDFAIAPPGGEFSTYTKGTVKRVR